MVQRGDLRREWLRVARVHARTLAWIAWYTGRVRGADQLPGPPLGEWLLHVLKARVAIVCGRGVRSELAGEVLTLAAAQGWVAGDDGPFAALVVLQVLGAGDVSEDVGGFAGRVVPGGLVIELGHPPTVRPWHVWRWLRAGRPLRTAAELRAQAWLGFGLYAVEQWAPVDLPRVLVTCGQRRAIPRA